MGAHPGPKQVLGLWIGPAIGDSAKFWLSVLYLAVRNLEEFRGRNAGIRSSGWKQALQAFAFTIYFEGRIPAP